jgi:hypothetical protein
MWCTSMERGVGTECLHGGCELFISYGEGCGDRMSPRGYGGACASIL